MMDSGIWRGAVVGFGRMGLTHFSILGAHPNVRLVAVCDSSGYTLKNVARYLEVQTYSDMREMCEATALDFVVVATPTADHADAIRVAVERGLHVFVEKPLALTAAQGQEILNLPRHRSLVNQVGYVLRFSDVFQHVRILLATQAIGDLLSFTMEMHGPTVLHGARNNWRSRKEEGGGCLHDFASHAIDLVHYLVGMPDEVTGTVFQTICSANVEDAISSTLLYRSGLLGHLRVNWSDPSYRKPTCRFEALGRQGKIVADSHEYRIFLRPRASYNGFAEGWNHRYVTDLFQPVNFYLRGYEFTRQLDHFVDCLTHGRPSTICSFEQAHQTDQIIEQLHADAKRRPFPYGVGQNHPR